MAVINILNINVVANVDKAVKGFGRINKEVSGVQAAVTRAATKLAALGTAFTAAAISSISLSKAISAVNESFVRLDRLGKTAEKLGLASENLAGLRFAAEQTGVAVTALDVGLQRMVRRIAEAAQDTGEAQSAIKELGLNARRLVQLSPDQQFRAIADAMMGVVNQSDRVRLGFKLFDTEGVALVNTLRGGSRALDEFQMQAEKLGIAVNDEAIQSVEDMNDAFNRSRKSVEGFVNAVAVRLAPYLKISTDLLTQQTEAIDRNISKRTAEANEAIALLQMVSRISRFVSSFNIGTGVGDIVKRKTDQAVEALSNWGEAVADARRKGSPEFLPFDVVGANGIAVQIADAVAEVEKPLTVLDKMFSDIREKLQGATLSSRDFFKHQAIDAGATTKELGKLLSMWDALAEAEKKLANDRRIESFLETVLDSIKTPLDRFAEYIRSLNELGGMLTDEQRKTAIEAMAERLGLLGSSVVRPAGSPQALQRGSAEQRSFQIASMNRLLGRDESAEKERKRQTKLQELISQNTATTANALAGLQSVVIVDR